jgi:hypothetical protein
MKHKYLYESALIFLLVGCSAVQPTSFPPTLISGGEPPLPVYSETPENQASQTSVSHIEGVEVDLPSCFENIKDEISLASITKGTLVSRGSMSPILLEIQSNKVYEISLISENSFISDRSVSPNRDLLATIETVVNEARQFEQMYLQVFNAQGEVVKKIIFDAPGLRKIRWLDNENILLYTANTTRDGTVLLVNPFSNEQTYITNELPNFFDESDLLFPDLKWLIEYSPNLEWGVYLKRGTSGDIATPFPGGPNIGHAVYDFSANKAIWIPKYPTDFSEEPKWSPDGGKVVIEANNQLTIVMRNGPLEPILDETKTNTVQFTEWSPDGRYIAFWNINKFMFYDIQENTLHDVCINASADFPKPLFAWSPDSQYIFLGNYSEANSVLVDIKENKIYQTSTNPAIYYPVAWMNSVP